MGGIGSGRRWHDDARETTSDYRSIDIRNWKREGHLRPGSGFNIIWSKPGHVSSSIGVRVYVERAILSYRNKTGSGPWQDKQYPVFFDHTACQMGGERHWFLCPGEGCGRRVAILYGGPGFACRRCHDLAYPSQRELFFDRAARRTDWVRERLDWKPGFLNGHGLKPKGMHWKTFERLIEEHDGFTQLSVDGFAERYGVPPLVRAYCES